MLYLVMDLFFYNFTPYLSYLFLLNINNKSLVYIISLGFLLDFILNMWCYNLIFIILLYLIKKYFFKFNYNNIFYYYVVNIGIIITYFLVSMIIFSSVNWVQIINVLIINSIFILISYKINTSNILFSRWWYGWISNSV